MGAWDPFITFHLLRTTAVLGDQTVPQVGEVIPAVPDEATADDVAPPPIVGYSVAARCTADGATMPVAESDGLPYILPIYYFFPVSPWDD